MNTRDARVLVVLCHRVQPMQKQLTVTMDESVYRGLYDRVGPGKISRFIEQLVRPHVLPKELDDAYAGMARDEDREAEAVVVSNDASNRHLNRVQVVPLSATPTVLARQRMGQHACLEQSSKEAGTLTMSTRDFAERSGALFSPVSVEPNSTFFLTGA